MSESQDRLDRMTKELTSIDQKEAGDFINEMMDVIKEPAKRIPENVFREIFLPVFAGLNPDLEKRTHEFVSHWVGVVGSPTEPADVVDVQGNRLFTVPPIFDVSRLNTGETGRGGSSYANMFTNLVETSTVNPHAAAGEFTLAASDKLNRIIKPESVGGNPWEEVFVHYNLIQKTPVEAVDTAESKNIDNDFTFD